jgi:hypothetical protein
MCGSQGLIGEALIKYHQCYYQVVIFYYSVTSNYLQKLFIHFDYSFNFFFTFPHNWPCSLRKAQSGRFSWDKITSTEISLASDAAQKDNKCGVSHFRPRQQTLVHWTNRLRCT